MVSNFLDRVVLTSWISFLKACLGHLTFLSAYHWLQYTSDIPQDPFTLIYDCRYVILMNICWFALTEKTLKENFILNLTNARSGKLLLLLLDQQESAVAIATEQGNLLFFNEPFIKIAIKPMRSNIMELVEGESKVLLDQLLKSVNKT